MIITINIFLAIISFAVGLWWFYRMRKEKTLSLLTNLEYLLLAVFCTYSSIACMFVAQHSSSLSHIIVHIVEGMLILLTLPIIYNIIADITKTNMGKRRMWLSFSPAVIAGVVIGLLHFISKFTVGAHSSSIIFLGKHIFTFALFLQLLIFGSAVLKIFIEYRQKIFCYYVDIQTTDFAKVHNILMCFFYTIIIAYLQILFQRSSIDIDGNNVVLLVANLCIVVIIGFVGWNLANISGDTVVIDIESKPYTPAEIMEITKIAEDEITENKTTDTVSTSQESPSAKAIEDIINQWTQRADKPYLKEGISLAMAAEDMGLNLRIVSIYLNTVLQVNFNAWINSLRIEEAKRILDSHSELPVSVIAFKCGFADTPMLSKNFKKIVGMTVTEYKKKKGLV